MAESLMQLYDSMTLTAQKELYDFAKFLVSKDGKKKSESLFSNRRAGIGKDPDFYMSPDFDEPLDCFKEYMK